jgi:hypothetical protein
MRRAQLSFGDGLIHEEVEDLRENWMIHADQVLEDEQLVATVYEALAKRHPNSRSRGRKATPADVVLRLLILKHVRNWSYAVLEREVRANLVYRDFTRVGAAKMPDAKTMGRWGRALGPQVIKRIHERIVQIAKARGDRRAPNARGHNRNRNQYPLSDRLEPARRRRARIDPHHQEDHQDRRRGWSQITRPQPKRKTARP